MKPELITNLLPKVYFVMKMLISGGYWPPFRLCVSPAEDRAFVHCRHLMTVILNTHRMLSRFCLHSYQNEVLGGPHLSITAGLQLFASLWPGFSSQAYKLSLNSVEQGPFNPLLSLSPDKCSSAASPRHMPPSYLLLSSIRWPVLHSHTVHCQLLYLYGSMAAESQNVITFAAMICIHFAEYLFCLLPWTGLLLGKGFVLFPLQPVWFRLDMLGFTLFIYSVKLVNINTS